MEYVERLFTVPNLETIINKEPLTVTPDTSLRLAIAMMSQRKDTSDQTSNADDTSTARNADYSCVLVVEDTKLLGIVTERDIVMLSAKQISFESVTVAEVILLSGAEIVPVLITSPANGDRETRSLLNKLTEVDREQVTVKRRSLLKSWLGAVAFNAISSTKAQAST